ncbi:MAG TPA: SRPBCC family protein [Solirubrobacteraceae bacterium]|nr:SRPBCC family protein [Solirubrobacteraceae bacterium]
MDERQQDAGARNGDDGAGETIAQELKDAVREAALEVLGPAARQATSSAARYAVSKAPELVAKNVMPAVWKAGGPSGLAQQAMSRGGEALSGVGGIGGIAGKLMSKLGRGGGGGQASGWGRNRRMPVQQVTYVSVPVRDAYNGWTEYKQWPRYMHRANQVDAQISDREARVKVTEKMWGFKRPFTAEIVSQQPDEHIRWNSTEGTKHAGVINFHELGPRLTLIELNLDHSPSGSVEKLARGLRFVKRAVRADFHRFQGWIEMKSSDELEQLEGWRGTIEGGRIVISHEDALEEEQRDEDDRDQEPGGEYDKEVESEYDEEPEEGFAEEESEDEEYEEEPESEYEADEPEEDFEEPEPEDDDYEPEPDSEYDDEPGSDGRGPDEGPDIPRRRPPHRRVRQRRRQPAANSHRERP